MTRKLKSVDHDRHCRNTCRRLTASGKTTSTFHSSASWVGAAFKKEKEEVKRVEELIESERIEGARE